MTAKEFILEHNIKKAIKALEDAYEAKFNHNQTEEGINDQISEEEAIYDYDLKPSELRQMEESGLQFWEEDSEKFYNAIEFEAFYDQFLCAETEE